jgi:hypothetical protein
VSPRFMALDRCDSVPDYNAKRLLTSVDICVPFVLHDGPQGLKKKPSSILTVGVGRLKKVRAAFSFHAQ